MIDWTHWHNETVLIGGLIFLGWLYALLTGPLRTRLDSTAPYPRGHAVKFYAALLCFYLAVGSPLDQIAERGHSPFGIGHSDLGVHFSSPSSSFMPC